MKKRQANLTGGSSSFARWQKEAREWRTNTTADKPKGYEPSLILQEFTQFCANFGSAAGGGSAARPAAPCETKFKQLALHPAPAHGARSIECGDGRELQRFQGTSNVLKYQRGVNLASPQPSATAGA